MNQKTVLTTKEKTILGKGKIPRDRFMEWLLPALEKDKWNTLPGNEGSGASPLDFPNGTPLSFLDERIGASHGYISTLIRRAGTQKLTDAIAFDTCDRIVGVLGGDWYSDPVLSSLYERINLHDIDAEPVTPTCIRCGKERSSGSGFKFCTPCSVLSAREARDRLNARLRNERREKRNERRGIS